MHALRCFLQLNVLLQGTGEHVAVMQVFREPSVDTKVVVASGPDTILIAFRGTASWANVVKDMQARLQSCVTL